jgi:hypothetical protein
MNEPKLSIGLASWIIQDGNYKDFSAGDIAAFALEFGETETFHLEHNRAHNEAVGLSNISASTYNMRARVIHVDEQWWAVDAGIRLFQKRPPPKNVRAGSIVAARCYVGVDPFFYFERLSKLSGSPALIYDWRVDKIELCETPWVEVRPRSFQRDADGESWREVEQTNAWTDDDGCAEYVLRCTLLSESARSFR